MAPELGCGSVGQRYRLEHKSWPQLLQHVKYWRTHANEELSRSAYQHIEFIAHPNKGYRVYAIGPADLELMTPNTLLVADMPTDDQGSRRQQLHWRPLCRADKVSSSSQLSEAQKLMLERRRSPCLSGVQNYHLEPPHTAVAFVAGSQIHSFVDADMAEVHVPCSSTHADTPLDVQVCGACANLSAYVLDGDIHIRYDNNQQQVGTSRATFIAGDVRYVNEFERVRFAGTPSFVMQEEFDRFTGLWWQPKQHLLYHSHSVIQAAYYLLFEVVDESEVALIDLSAPGSTTEHVNLFRYPLVGTANAHSSVHLLRVTVTMDEHGNLCGEQPLRHEPLELPSTLTTYFAWAEYVVRMGWLTHVDGQCQDYVWLQLLSRDQCRMSVVLLHIDAFAGNADVAPGHILLIYDQHYPVPYLTTDCVQWLASTANASGRPVFKFIHMDDSLNGYAHLVMVSASPNEPSAAGTEQQQQLYTTCDYHVQAITTGDWPIITQITPKIDLERQLVYFVGVKDDPLEMHLYQCSLTDSASVVRLTALGHSHRVAMHDAKMALVCDFGFVAWRSALSSPLQLCVYAFTFDDDDRPIGCRLLATVAEPAQPPPMHHTQLGSWPLATGDSTDSSRSSPFDPSSTSSTLQLDERGDHNMQMQVQRPPELQAIFRHSSPVNSSLFAYGSAKFDVPEIHALNVSGVTYYAMLLRPCGWQAHVSHPVLLHVYAGPEVQLVNKSAQTWKHRKYQQLGYAVVLIDGPGTANRGRAFENMIRKKMGQVEVDVQVACLQQLAQLAAPLLDLSRVAVFGFSYGGYTSLLALCQRPDIFKVAIAGSPVTSWHLYDTAYTERYMGRPDRGNLLAYTQASIIDAAHMLPDELVFTPGLPDRLLLLHGLCDENVHVTHTLKLVDRLIKLGKPYSLQIYPRERHGIRSAPAYDHMEATVLALLQRQFAL